MTLIEHWHLEIFNHSTATNTSEYLLVLKADSSPIFSVKDHTQYNVLTALSLAVNLHDLCQMSREWNRPSSNSSSSLSSSSVSYSDDMSQATLSQLKTKQIISKIPLKCELIDNWFMHQLLN